MIIEIKVNAFKNKIECYCEHSSWTRKDNVMTLLKNGDTWHTGSSRTLPSSIEDSQIILECMRQGFEKMRELQASG